MNSTTRTRRTTTWTWNGSTRRQRRISLWNTTRWNSLSLMRITRCTWSTSQIGHTSPWWSTTSNVACRSIRPLPQFVTPRTTLKYSSWAASTIITSANTFALWLPPTWTRLQICCCTFRFRRFQLLGMAAHIVVARSLTCTLTFVSAASYPICTWLPSQCSNGRLQKTFST